MRLRFYYDLHLYIHKIMPKEAFLVTILSDNNLDNLAWEASCM